MVDMSAHPRLALTEAFWADETVTRFAEKNNFGCWVVNTLTVGFAVVDRHDYVTSVSIVVKT